MNEQQEGIKKILQSLLEPASLEIKLSRITDGITELFNADFCRIWMIRPGDRCEQGCVHAAIIEGPHICSHREKCLHLLASSGRYTHLDGKVHQRVPFGCYKIGLIASGEEHKFLIDNVVNDSRIHDLEWARSLGLVSFAGYQIRNPDGATSGVLALFSKRHILPAEDAMLEGLSGAIALAIQQADTENTLRENTIFLKTLLNALPFPVYYKDCNCRYIGINKAYEELIGANSDQILGRCVYDTSVPPHLAEIYDSKDQELLQDPGTQVYETQIRDVNGSMRDVVLHKATFTDSKGQLQGLIGAILDVTDLKQAEEAFHLQAVELEQEIAERQVAKESLLAQAYLLEKEINDRRKAQNDLQKMNEQLEKRVQKRTTELFERNHDLQSAYDDLKKMQAQLLQQDKMASIGQLAAGVAHEVNNPVGFIISNLGSLGKYIDKITAFLEVTETLISDCDPAIRAAIAQESQKLKIARICKDMPNLINESSDGAQRVRQIVQDMKQFSRVDHAEFAYSDIQEGLESTISIAWNELKYKTNIVKNYSQLPKVWCNLGQINQVFLNILMNACHAIDVYGEIRISTWEEQGIVKIAISDTGSGIKPETLNHIFEPFFTTKDVGKGTGLGLSIAYDIIVVKHNGLINVESEVGKGSTFTISLPISKGDRH
jgi:PAS domain S-box-containing protein